VDRRCAPAAFVYEAEGELDSFTRTMVFSATCDESEAMPNDTKAPEPKWRIEGTLTDNSVRGDIQVPQQVVILANSQSWYCPNGYRVDWSEVIDLMSINAKCSPVTTTTGSDP
jgi:hypothetical protein